jgi:hypothetical protein
MALPAGLYQTLVGNKGLGIISRQDAVKTVTVRTTCNQFGITQVLDLSMIAFVIGLRGNGENLVPLHHLCISMAFLTYLGMKLLPKFDHLGFLPLEKRDLVEAMAVTTGG